MVASSTWVVLYLALLQGFKSRRPEPLRGGQTPISTRSCPPNRLNEVILDYYCVVLLRSYRRFAIDARYPESVQCHYYLEVFIIAYYDYKYLRIIIRYLRVISSLTETVLGTYPDLLFPAGWRNKKSPGIGNLDHYIFPSCFMDIRTTATAS